MLKSVCAETEERVNITGDKLQLRLYISPKICISLLSCCDWYQYRVNSDKFGHTFANSGNPDETAPYEPSHQDFHCLLS